MALEIFGLYTEVDPNSHIGVLANRATAIGINNGGDNCYLYTDKGAGYFGDFVVNFQFLISAAADYAYMILCGFSDTIGVESAWANGIYLAHKGGGVAGQSWVQWHGVIAGVGYGLTCTHRLPALNTLYYATATRIGMSFKWDVYLDAARTNLLFTESVPLLANLVARYLYALASIGAAAGYATSGYIENIELNPTGETKATSTPAAALDIVGIQYAYKKPFTAPLESYEAIYRTPRVLQLRGGAQVDISGGAFKVERK